MPALLDWPVVHSKMAWSVVIVLGGGFALADATKVDIKCFSFLDGRKNINSTKEYYDIARVIKK